MECMAQHSCGGLAKDFAKNIYTCTDIDFLMSSTIILLHIVDSTQMVELVKIYGQAIWITNMLTFLQIDAISVK